MDAGSFVIALLAAAGAAAGPAGLGALPDTAAAPAARCIATPDGDESTGSRDSGALDLPQRSDSARIDADTLAERRAGAGGRDTGRDTAGESRASTSALAEELARELAEVVAGSDDPTERLLAEALAAAGFEADAEAAPGARERDSAASRSDDADRAGRLDDRPGRLGDDPGDSRLDDTRLDQDRLDDNRLDQDRLGDDELAENRLDQDRLDQDRLDQDRLDQDRLDQDRLDGGRLDQDRGQDQLDCDGRAPERDADGEEGSDLGDLLSSAGSDDPSVEPAADRDRPVPAERGSGAPVERGGSDIASVLERGEGTAG
jgi:hypothetical protein